MIKRLVLICLLAALAGCSGETPAPEQAPPAVSESSASAPESEPTAPVDFGGVEGVYSVLTGSRFELDNPDNADERVQLVETMDLYGSLVLVWRYGPEDAGKTLIDCVNPRNGEVLFNSELDGAPYSGETAAGMPENYRVNLRDRIVYLSGFGPETGSELPLPENVLSALWSPEPDKTGAPYDYSREGDTLAWAAADGVYASGADGAEPELVLANTLLPEMIAGGRVDPETGGAKPYELPEYTPEQLSFVAPRLLGGGKRLAATAWLAEPPMCLGVSLVDLETKAVSHLPFQPEPDMPSFAARRFGDSSLVMPAMPFSLADTARDVRIYGRDVLDTPFDGDNASHTWDMEHHVRVRESVGVGGEKRLELYRYRLAAPDRGTALLSTTRDYLLILDVSENHILCEVGDMGEGGESAFLIVPYNRV